MGNKKNMRTPIIKPRKQDGTFYTFGSALEDIGLNINELQNKIAISHYVLLDIPDFNGTFDTKATETYGDLDSSYKGDYVFADGMQNYVLNMETVIRNSETYDFTNSRTVSERIFWKWLGNAMSLSPRTGVNGKTLYIDENSVAKAFGQINSGAQRSDDYSMYNETFVQIPSSMGQMRVLYRLTEDDNYYVSEQRKYECSSTGFIENISPDEIDENGRLKVSGVSASAIYDGSANGTGYYEIKDVKDSISVELDMDALRGFYGDESLTMDDLAIDKEGYVIADDFAFNAVLIYYSIYDSTGKNTLATNAYGLLVLNHSEAFNGGSKFTEIMKKRSTSTASGTSYSFRLNVKTSSVYSGDVAVTDNSTPAYSMSTDFNDTVKNLNTAINALRSNANLIAEISTDNRTLKELAATALDKIDDLEKTVNALKAGKFKNVTVSDTACVIADSSVLFYSGSALVGNVDGNALSFDTVKANSLVSADITANSLQTSKVKGNLSFVSETADEECASVQLRGISAKDFFLPNRSNSASQAITPEMAEEALSRINVYYDSSSAQIMINVNSDSLLSGIIRTADGYVNMAGILALLIAKNNQNDR